MPHQPAGSRSEPPMSVPRCSGPYPAAAAAPAPALEPPGVLLRSQGLRASLWKLESPEDNMPKSGMVVLARITPPCSRTRAAGGASAVAGTSSVAAVPRGVGSPRVAMLFLMATVTHCGWYRKPCTESSASRRCRSPSSLVRSFALAVVLYLLYRSSNLGEW